MFRIAGVVNILTGGEEVSTMLETMRKGGPDDRGIYTDPDLQGSFGHQRLSIIDLSASGHQPFILANDELVMTYIGELYNYRELRQELEGEGVIFHTQTDTEVVLQAYCFWGEACIEKFNRMYAFAILDRGKIALYWPETMRA